MHLAKHSTRAPHGLDKAETKEELKAILEELDELQNRLYASKAAAVLLISQGMDASGKDGLIRDVAGAMNPQGVAVHSFKVPTEEERAHDFLWRIHQRVPALGMVHVFNRSHYEDVLVTRVHGHISDKEAHRRMEHINAFEKLLQDSGTIILKLYLHVSEERQLERLNERISDPKKMWKHNAGDFAEVKRRAEYERAYEDVFNRCAAVPWHIIPADQNWYKSYAAAKILRDALVGLNMQYPGLKKESAEDM